MTTGLERPYSNPGTQLLVCEDLHPPPQGWAPGPQDQSLCGQTAETRGGALCGKLGLAPVGTDACWPAHWGPLSGCLGWPSQMTAKTTERGSLTFQSQKSQIQVSLGRTPSGSSQGDSLPLWPASGVPGAPGPWPHTSPSPSTVTCFRPLLRRPLVPR